MMRQQIWLGRSNYWLISKGHIGTSVGTSRSHCRRPRRHLPLPHHRPPGLENEEYERQRN